MADKQNRDDPEYRWLYSGERSGSDPSSDATQHFPAPDGRSNQEEGDSERTSVINPTNPPPGGPGGASRGGEDDDTATRVIAAQPASRDAQQADAGDARPTSFGGTYGPPPPRPETEPRFATPTQPPQPGARSAPPSRPPAARAPSPRRPRRRRNWWLRGALALVLVWIVFLVAVPIWAYAKVSKVDAEPGGDRPADTPGATYLLVGSDSRADLSEEERGQLATGDAEGQRTDTIMLLHVPDGGGPKLLLSIPRDSYVEIPGQGENKINAAYAFGGPELLVQTVELNTGVRVDSYIEVGFSGFVDVVDALGGIEVCPKTKIDDPLAGQLKMDPGCQDVDGPTALQYSRSRAFGNGDITRALHQREVISAVGQKAASWQTVVLPWRYFKISKAGGESLRAGEDVGPMDLARFAWAMGRPGSDAKRCVVPYSTLAASTPAGSAVLWDEERAAAVFDAIQADDTASIVCTERR